MIESIAAWALLICIAAWALSDRLVAALAWLDRHNAETDAQAAADHHEPSREQIEWELHIAEAIRLTQEDAEADCLWDELELMASVLADIDGLPDGAA